MFRKDVRGISAQMGRNITLLMLLGYQPKTESSLILSKIQASCTGPQLRKLFVHLMTMSSMKNPGNVWSATWKLLSDYIVYTKRHMLKIPGNYNFVVAVILKLFRQCFEGKLNSSRIKQWINFLIFFPQIITNYT